MSISTDNTRISLHLFPPINDLQRDPHLQIHSRRGGGGGGGGKKAEKGKEKRKEKRKRKRNNSKRCLPSWLHLNIGSVCASFGGCICPFLVLHCCHCHFITFLVFSMIFINSSSPHGSIPQPQCLNNARNTAMMTEF